MRAMFTWFVSLACFAAVAAAGGVDATDEELFAYDIDHPAVGVWIGDAVTGEGVTVFVLLVAELSDDEWSVKITALAGGLLDAACKDVEVSGCD